MTGAVGTCEGLTGPIDRAGRACGDGFGDGVLKHLELQVASLRLLSLSLFIKKTKTATSQGCSVQGTTKLATWQDTHTLNPLTLRSPLTKIKVQQQHNVSTSQNRDQPDPRTVRACNVQGLALETSLLPSPRRGRGLRPLRPSSVQSILGTASAKHRDVSVCPLLSVV